MSLQDLFFGTDFFNREGRKNIRGDELAAMLQTAQNPGALAVMSAPQVVPDSGAPVPLVGFDAIEYDDLGFVIPTGFRIPNTEPAITRITTTIQIVAFGPVAAFPYFTFLGANGLGFGTPITGLATGMGFFDPTIVIPIQGMIGPGAQVVGNSAGVDVATLEPTIIIPAGPGPASIQAFISIRVLQ